MSDDKFQFYNCRVRLNGSLLNEAPKRGISAAEVHMLRSEHGEGSVVDLKVASEKDIPEVPAFLAEEIGVDPKDGWTEKVIREHLNRKFNRKTLKVEKVLGNSLTPLPRYIPLAEREAPKKEVDEAALRADIEAKVRAEYEEKAKAEEALTEKAKAEAEALKAAEDAKAAEATKAKVSESEKAKADQKAALEALG